MDDLKFRTIFAITNMQDWLESLESGNPDEVNRIRNCLVQLITVGSDRLLYKAIKGLILGAEQDLERLKEKK